MVCINNKSKVHILLYDLTKISILQIYITLILLQLILLFMCRFAFTADLQMSKFLVFFKNKFI